ncbi:hypothetical protein [Paenibacillus illinoisensis]|uniref:Uncharacterized protein n=1 Tax=Paenibacillus illinoisensis TaxID=59845 RepID=A0A2W0CC15_9BACL|nr:hypothetical protein [Paenibacillus illinoisensis]PYY28229.1 hypothetical protein PIL02S_03375 [Paenibacillus illinoisensis]
MINPNFYQFSDAISRRIEGALEEYIIFELNSLIIIDYVLYDDNNEKFISSDVPSSLLTSLNDIRLICTTYEIKTLEELKSKKVQIDIRYHQDCTYKEFYFG